MAMARNDQRGSRAISGVVLLIFQASASDLERQSRAGRWCHVLTWV
jgi:hypothetical protein